MLVTLVLSHEEYLYLIFLLAIFPVLLGLYTGVRDEYGRRRIFDVRNYDIGMDADDVRIHRNEPDFALRDRIERDLDRNRFDDVWRP